MIGSLTLQNPRGKATTILNFTTATPGAKCVASPSQLQALNPQTAGDPPNIIVGNLLSDYLTFTDFLTNLGPGVLLACPFAFVYLTWYFGDGLRGSINADIANLQKSYPITNKPLLVKCSTVLSCVVLSFFLHAGKIFDRGGNLSAKIRIHD